MKCKCSVIFNQSVNLVHVPLFCMSYLSDFAGGEVPDLDEAVHGASNQVLTIRGESGTLHVRFLSKLSREERRVTSGHLNHLSGIVK